MNSAAQNAIGYALAQLLVITQRGSDDVSKLTIKEVFKPLRHVTRNFAVLTGLQLA